MRRGRAFVYFDQNGNAIKDKETSARIQSIGVPPAYEKVWICPWANGHIQAIGYDARGRKQYRYHPKWREVRDLDKFNHIVAFGKALPRIRQSVSRDLRSKELTRRKVLATVVALLEKTLIRIGNAEYARDNESYGLTTLRKKHIDVRGETIGFHFVGKSGKKWDLSIHDRRIASVVKRCSELPGHELFKYMHEDNQVHEVTSTDVNNYLKEVTKEGFTAKDFRTWSGTILAALALSEFEKSKTNAQAKKNITRAIERVAKQLGNTPSICRKCYVHPEILAAYLSGETIGVIKHKIDAATDSKVQHISENEKLVLSFLRKRLSRRRTKKLE